MHVMDNGYNYSYIARTESGFTLGEEILLCLGTLFHPALHDVHVLLGI